MNLETENCLTRRCQAAEIAYYQKYIILKSLIKLFPTISRAVFARFNSGQCNQIGPRGGTSNSLWAADSHQLMLAGSRQEVRLVAGCLLRLRSDLAKDKPPMKLFVY